MTLGPQHEHGALCCPACTATLKRSTQLDGDGAAPTAGDMTFCSTCLTVLVFVNAATLRAATPLERSGFLERLRQWHRNQQS